MSYKASFSRTIRGSLEPDVDHEANIDRVHAFALSTNKLSDALWRIKYANDSTMESVAISELIRVARVSQNAAICALHEWVSPECRRCGGRAEMQVGNRVILCSACQNHKRLHRYSDRERASYLRISLASARRLKDQITKAFGVISTADIGVSGGMSNKLND